MINGQIPIEQLLAEIEDVLRITPSQIVLKMPSQDNFAWQGRASAAVKRWDSAEGIMFDMHASAFASESSILSEPGYHGMLFILNKARADIRLNTVGPTNIAIGQGQVYHYFDELRKVVELARKEVFFVDPYMDADFVSRYLPQVHEDASVRLMTTTKSARQLVPAVEAFCAQTGRKATVKVSSELHDRYLFIDGSQCYQSGASFKDGAKNAPTTFTQITDAFSAVLKTYEDMWASAKVPEKG